MFPRRFEMAPHIRSHDLQNTTTHYFAFVTWNKSVRVLGFLSLLLSFRMSLVYIKNRRLCIANMSTCVYFLFHVRTLPTVLNLGSATECVHRSEYDVCMYVVGPSRNATCIKINQMCQNASNVSTCIKCARLIIMVIATQINARVVYKPFESNNHIWLL
jgi:hypothetical protein